MGFNKCVKHVTAPVPGLRWSVSLCTHGHAFFCFVLSSAFPGVAHGRRVDGGSPRVVAIGSPTDSAVTSPRTARSPRQSRLASGLTGVPLQRFRELLHVAPEVVEAIPSTVAECGRVMARISTRPDGVVTVDDVRRYLEDRSARLVQLPRPAYIADSVLARGHGLAVGLPSTAYRGAAAGTAAPVPDSARAVFSPTNRDRTFVGGWGQCRGWTHVSNGQSEWRGVAWCVAG